MNYLESKLKVQETVSGDTSPEVNNMIELEDEYSSDSTVMDGTSSSDEIERELSQREINSSHHDVNNTSIIDVNNVSGNYTNINADPVSNKVPPRKSPLDISSICDDRDNNNNNSSRKRNFQQYEDNLYVCSEPSCKKRFTQTGDLKRHQRIHTGQKPYACEECGRDFSRLDTLKEHKRTHTGEKPYACTFSGCNKKFSKSGNLRQHQRTHTGERRYICQEPGCNKKFMYSGDLKRHKRSHTGDSPYACDHPNCNKKFGRMDTLKTHRRTHIPKDTFITETVYNSRPMVLNNATPNLKTHQFINAEEKPFACTENGCDKKFLRSGDLKRHQRGHTGERPYQCDQCSMKFGRLDTLKTHKHTHGIKEKVCEEPGCNKRFSKTSNLRSHQLIHTGEKRYVCSEPDCGKKFMRSGDLKRHERGHTGEKPYACEEPGCTKKFGRLDSLKTHQRTHTNN